MTENEEKTMIASSTVENEEKELSEEELFRAIEAVLFAAGYPVPMEKLCQVFSKDKREMRKIAAELCDYFNSLQLGIMILNFEDSLQLCTKEEFKNYIREALGIKMSGKLSASSLEVLAIIAYNQPVTKAFVENIRGVDCSYAISSLMDKGLVDSKDRLDVPGRPMLYSTTENFLRCFGISKLDELPNLDIKASSLQNSNNDSDGEQMTLNI